LEEKQFRNLKELIVCGFLFIGSIIAFTHSKDIISLLIFVITTLGSLYLLIYEAR
jgi:hypothetical protein